MPDDHISVLVYAPEADEPVWIGWYDGVYWFSSEGGEYAPDAVKAWAEMPRGLCPKPQERDYVDSNETGGRDRDDRG